MQESSFRKVEYRVEGFFKNLSCSINGCSIICFKHFLTLFCNATVRILKENEFKQSANLSSPAGVAVKVRCSFSVRKRALRIPQAGDMKVRCYHQENK